LATDDGSSQPTRRAFDLEGQEEEEASPKKRGKTLAAYAEAHELDVKELYDLEVGLEEGDEPVKLSALKDHYKATREFERIRDDFEDYRSQTQSEIIQGRQQIDQLLVKVAQFMPPDQLREIGQAIEAESRVALEKGRRQLREWFPEWSNPDVAKKARDQIWGALKDYGVTEVEFLNITDPRLIRILYDATRAINHVKRLKSGEREQKAAADQAPSTKRHRPSTNQKAQELARRGDKIGAIATYLGG